MTTERLIISAPFGNYLRAPGTTSTVGTYTLQNRAGFMRWWLFWRILRTLRYKPGLGWVNKLGLPNPGINHALSKFHYNRSWAKGKIISIHGLQAGDWDPLLAAVRQLDPAAVELNVSCPNVGHVSVPTDLFKKAMNLQTDIAGIPTTVPVIVKLPPVNYWETFKLALASGVTTFHCCNTLPIPAGGLSGKPVQKVALDVIKRIKDHDPDLTIIGGGGITTPEDIETYWKVGARRFAVGSKLLNPLYWLPSKRAAFFKRLAEKADSLAAAEKGTA